MDDETVQVEERQGCEGVNIDDAAGTLMARAYASTLPADNVGRLWCGSAKSLAELVRHLAERPESTYGEITPAGVRALTTRTSLGEGDVFADLGSGLGRCTLQVFLETRVARAVGIELDLERHTAAVSVVRDGIALSASLVADVAIEKLGRSSGMTFDDNNAMARWRGLDDGRVLELCCRDVLQAWRLWHGATVAYCSSLCFPDAVMEQLADQLDECRRLRWVASLRMLPRYRTFTLVTVECWPMSWRAGGCSVYLYGRLPCYPLGHSLLEEPLASLARAAERTAEKARSSEFSRGIGCGWGGPSALLLRALLPLALSQAQPSTRPVPLPRAGGGGG